MQGKGHEMKARQAFNDNSLETAFNDIYGRFLSAKEIRAVIDGKDLWMNREEVLSRFNGTYAKTEKSTAEDTHTNVPARRRGRPRKA